MEIIEFWRSVYVRFKMLDRKVILLAVVNFR